MFNDVQNRRAAIHTKIYAPSRSAPFAMLRELVSQLSSTHDMVMRCLPVSRRMDGGVVAAPTRA